MLQIIILNLLLTLAWLQRKTPSPSPMGIAPWAIPPVATTASPSIKTVPIVIEKRGVNFPPGDGRSGSRHCKQGWNLTPRQ